MEKQDIRTFGRRHGKKLSNRQQWLVDNLLPQLTPDTNTDTILEIGFGAGEHLLQLSRELPNHTIIGAEPYINGVASLLSQITTVDNAVKPEYKNIRIWPDDARLLLNNSAFRFSLSTLQNINFFKIYILHPDPWPKARHEKRRLLHSDFLNLLANHLDTNGKIIIGTDHTDYFNWVIEQAKKTNLKSAILNSEIIETRYQIKNKFGSDAPMYLVLTKS